MIVQIRVDDRLIHGQVALVWSKELNTPGIIVANDEAANNETVKMTLKMATPSGIKLLVRSVDDAVGVFNNEKAKTMRIFALTRNMKDTLKLVENCRNNIETVNVANVGRFDPTDISEKVALVGNTVLLNHDEIEATKKIVELMGDNVYHQLIPTNAKTPISKLLKKL